MGNPQTSSEEARSAVSKRMATGSVSLVAVLRDARKERAPQDEVERRVAMIRTLETQLF
jgi:hypothetical protein